MTFNSLYDVPLIVLYTPLEAAGLVATSLWIFVQLRCTQHDGAVPTMFPAERVLYSADSGNPHVPSSAQRVRRSRCSLRTDRFTKQRSSAEADTSAFGFTNVHFTRKKRIYKRCMFHVHIMYRQWSRLHCTATQCPSMYNVL